MKKQKLILGVTLGGSSRLLDGQAAYFRKLGYDVYLVSQNHYKEKLFCKRENISHLPVDIDSEINPLKDLKSLFQIFLHFKKVKPDIVNVGTPKMGLLGIIAAKLAGVKKKIYTCRGFRFETEKGIKRKILVWSEKISAQLADEVIFVSPSLKIKAQYLNIVDTNQGVLIGNGSSNGVDLEFFNSGKINENRKSELIEKYDLKNKVVIGFVGRVSKHKGAMELVSAFQQLQEKRTDIKLILMGHIDCSKEFENEFRSNKEIIHIPFQDNVPLYMSLFDMLVLPSWREGFPNVPIQAAAMGIPVIVSDATGCVDVIENEVNGFIFKCQNVNSLRNTMETYVEDKNLRIEHGKAGLKWAANFKPEQIWDGINYVYKKKNKRL